MIKKLLIGSTIYFSIIGVASTQNQLSKKDRMFLDKIEITNTCEDLLQWFKQDLESNKIDSIAFKSYTWNVKDMLERHKRLNGDKVIREGKIYNE